MANYERVVRDGWTGKTVGVRRDDGAMVPRDAENMDWRDFMIWNTAQPSPLDLSDEPPTARGPRPVPALVSALGALTAAQRTAIAGALFGPENRWATNRGANMGALAIIAALLQAPTLTAAHDILRLYGVALFLQDNPAFLVQPPFAPAVNVPGDELIG